MEKTLVIGKNTHRVAKTKVFRHTDQRQSLLSCSLPKSHKDKIPMSVSLVEKPCDTATNHLKVIYDKPKDKNNTDKGKKKRFAVCSKGHTFPNVDKSVKLVEWIEVLRSLGANVFIYHFNMHPNISKVLDYYSSKDLVDVTEVTIPGPDYNAPYVQFNILLGDYDRDR